MGCLQCCKLLCHASACSANVGPKGCWNMHCFDKKFFRRLMHVRGWAQGFLSTELRALSGQGCDRRVAARPQGCHSSWRSRGEGLLRHAVTISCSWCSWSHAVYSASGCFCSGAQAQPQKWNQNHLPRSMLKLQKEKRELLRQREAA